MYFLTLSAHFEHLTSFCKQTNRNSNYTLHTYIFICIPKIYIYYICICKYNFYPTKLHCFSRATLLGVYFSYTLFNDGSFVAVRLAAWALLRPLVN